MLYTILYTGLIPEQSTHMTDTQKDSVKTGPSKPEVPKWTAPKIEAIPVKFKWSDVGLDTFVMMGIISFVKGLNSFGEEKHIITAWQVNPNNDKVMGEEQYLFESNSPTTKKLYQDYFKDWNKNMVGTRCWLHMSSNQQVGLYIAKADNL